MSVQSELTRLENAKAAIKAAIEGKGVTVPDGTLLDGMAALIEAIEAGGGGDLSALGISKMASGTITIASSTTILNIYHNLSAMPKIIFTYTKDHGVILAYSDIAIASMFGASFENTDGNNCAICQVTGGRGGWTTLGSMHSVFYQGGFNGTDVFRVQSRNLIQCSYRNGAGYSADFAAGATYKWLVLA